MGIILVCELTATPLLTLFAKDDPVVTRLGAQYLRTYVTDTFPAGLHFCMSGFFTACNRSLYSFIHNIIAIAAVRIPGAILATALFPSTLYALGLAAPAGSLLSDLICLFLYLYGHKKKQST